MGLGKKSLDYYWADGGSSQGVRNMFTEITKYEDAEGCGYISSGATVSMTQCDVSNGFICEHTNGKETVKTAGCDYRIVLNNYQTDIAVNQ